MESAAIRTMKFTCIGRGHGAPAVPATREEWLQLRREPWLAEMCARIERGDDELKHRLPVWTPHCAEFANNHRAAADALKPLNRLMLDFDEKNHTAEICERLLAASPLPVLLIEESARRGTHVLVELPPGMDAETAQRLMAEATGYEPDRQVKGVDRCIYMVPEGHTKFVSEKLFDISNSSGAFAMRQQDNNGICNAVGIKNPHITSSRITNSAEHKRGLSKESKACIQFAITMAQYCLEQQIKAFGEALESQFVDARDECQRYGANHSIFDQLAPVFTMDDLRALKRGFCSEAGLRKIISRWYHDQWIEKTDKGHWKKLSAETL